MQWYETDASVLATGHSPLPPRHHPDLLLQLHEMYSVDAYLEHLGKSPSRLVRQASYWYSMWSHRRNQAWKGFVQIDLAPSADAQAIAQLENLANQGDPA